VSNMRTTEKHAQVARCASKHPNRQYDPVPVQCMYESNSKATVVCFYRKDAMFFFVGKDRSRIKRSIAMGCEMFFEKMTRVCILHEVLRTGT
jgi:hypothetical protein